MEEIKMEKAYNPKSIEEKWYSFWNNKGYFIAQTGDKYTNENSFSIVIPPPNVTGILHMGHALNATIHDIVSRYNKMNGKNVLWLPGTDHAGIATQNVVERQLAKENIKRQDLGREKFVEKVWEWKRKTGSIIIEQLKKMGAMCDWTRERFTMDEGLSKAVRKVFVTLYKEGLIYRGNRIINWCPRCTTALSNDEVEFYDLNGKLWYIRYPIIKNNNDSNIPDYIVVATTRPETMLGDMAVCVSPNDERYKNLIGYKVMLPLVNREIPIIADEYVDSSFGTGAVKVTPAHDPNDFEIGLRHNLQNLIIMDINGKINENAKEYMGLDRFNARKKIIEDLNNQGLLEKIEDYNHAVGHCYRCDTIIEPYLSTQWFVKMKPLAELAISAVRDGEIEFIPKRWEKTYFHWLENVKDWCISRQLWWGHRIPVWVCENCGHYNVSEEDVKECEVCYSSVLTQDEDVLDTWFSSALWPFSTLGWPNETIDLKTFYPTSMLITGFDIIYLWVARMIMMGKKFMGKVPFKKVYFTMLVRDEKGEKMSKSKGNAIDPMEIIDKYGTDALRFTFAALATTTADLNLSVSSIEGFRNFANKIWNAARFSLMNISYLTPSDIESVKKLSDLKLELPDKYILLKLEELIKYVRKNIDECEFTHAANAIYDFIWSELCDWYIEIIKPRFYTNDLKNESKFVASIVLNYVFIETMKLTHPFMPFITEEIYSLFPKASYEKESLLISNYPSYESFNLRTGLNLTENEKQETFVKFKLLKDIIIATRQIRAELNISPAVMISPILVCKAEMFENLINNNLNWIKTIMRAESLIVKNNIEEKPKNTALATVTSDLKINNEIIRVDIYVPLKDLIDVTKEKDRLNRELKKVDEELTRCLNKLQNQDFLTRANALAIEKEKTKYEKYTQMKEKLLSTLSTLE